MIKRIFQRIISFLGVIMLLLILYAAGLGGYVWYHRKDVADQTILELNFSGDYPEFISDDPIDSFMGRKSLSVRDIVEGLEIASQDSRIVGLIATVGNNSMGFGQIQEIRNAVQAFRSKGKSAVVFADTFGEFGPGNRGYYLASAFDQIYLQPSGDVALTGLMFETPFIKGTLDKLGVVPRMDHRSEYKNAMNTFTETEYTQHHKEALEAIMTSLSGQMAADISAARNLSESDVRAIFEKGIFLGKEAQEAKLVDGLAYRDAVYDQVKKTTGGDDRLSLAKYLAAADSLYSKGDTVALIYGVGGIRRGKSKYYSLFGDVSMGSESVTGAFRDAIEDEKVKAVIFRIDSPGGSYVASDSIWQETVRAKEAGKPVIVSMADVAGSGGYFIAMAADKIVAHPGTITGSIGVLAGKMVMSGLMEKLGISWDEIHSGPYASMWTDNQDYSPDQWQRVQDMLDRIYKDFTEKAAQGRNIPIETMLKAAGGRIWTGEDAKKIGLVDELGGFPEAIRLAKEAAGIPEDAPVNLSIFPKDRSWMDRILKKASRSIENENAAEAAFEEVRMLTQTLRRLGIIRQDGVLSMPDARLHPD